MTVFHALTVADVTPLCADAAVVTFARPDPATADFAFRPGQSLTLRRTVDGREERRSYSICSPAGSVLRIGVREVPAGTFSRWLVRDVRPGDRIDVSVPTGRFTPDLDVAGHHVAIAAGSGITPILSILGSVLERPGPAATLLYSNRRAGTVMFADEVADLKDRHPARLELVHVLSREPREAELLSGRLDAEHLAALLPAVCDPPQVGHWWLCGPMGMVIDARAVLAECQIPADRIHAELFYVEDVAPEPARHDEPEVSGDAHEVTVALDGRSTTLTLPPDQTILIGAQGGSPGRPVRLQGRRVRHVSGPGDPGRGRHATQLRPRAGGGRRRLRPHLPILRCHPGGDRRL